MNVNPKLPIVLACAGCSPVAKLSWELAKEMDRRGMAEMSCIAGFGAQKPAFLRKLLDREVWIIDGCPVHCGQGIFDLILAPVHKHIRLAELGFKKFAESYESIDMDALIDRVMQTDSFNMPATAKVNDATS